MSAAFALVSDAAMAILGGRLKRREKLSGRLADVLAWLYLASAAAKRFHDEGRLPREQPFVEWSCRHALHQIQLALLGLLDNFPSRLAAFALRTVVFPLGARYRPPSDALGAQVARALLEDREERLRITRDIYIPPTSEPGLGRLEAALDRAVEALAVETKIRDAVRAGRLDHAPGDALADLALSAGVITHEERRLMRAADEARDEVIRVDAFIPRRTGRWHADREGQGRRCEEEEVARRQSNRDASRRTHRRAEAHALPPGRMGDGGGAGASRRGPHLSGRSARHRTGVLVRDSRGHGAQPLAALRALPSGEWVQNRQQEPWTEDRMTADAGRRGRRRDPEDRIVDREDCDATREKMFDKTMADSFPASDPPSSIPDPSEDSFAPGDESRQPDQAETGGFSTIVCPVDSTEDTRATVAQAVALARLHEAELHFVGVSGSAFPDPPLAAMVTSALSGPAGAHASSDVRLRYGTARGDAAKAVLGYAHTHRADLIVISARYGASRWKPFAWAADRVARSASCPVLVLTGESLVPSVRDDPPVEVLCAIDFSEESLAALRAAIRFVRARSGRLTVLHVLAGHDRPVFSGSEAGQAARGHEDRVTVQTSRLLELEPLTSLTNWRVAPVVVSGQPQRAILRTAEETRADLIVLGMERRGLAGRSLTGSTSRAVVRRAKRPVLLVSGDADRGGRDPRFPYSLRRGPRA
jgi:nucleotide-binding universal stress UspA family protein